MSNPEDRRPDTSYEPGSAHAMPPRGYATQVTFGDQQITLKQVGAIGLAILAPLATVTVSAWVSVSERLAKAEATLAERGEKSDAKAQELRVTVESKLEAFEASEAKEHAAIRADVAAVAGKLDRFIDWMKDSRQFPGLDQAFDPPSTPPVQGPKRSSVAAPTGGSDAPVAPKAGGLVYQTPIDRCPKLMVYALSDGAACNDLEKSPEIDLACNNAAPRERDTFSVDVSVSGCEFRCSCGGKEGWPSSRTQFYIRD